MSTACSIEPIFCILRLFKAKKQKKKWLLFKFVRTQLACLESAFFALLGFLCVLPTSSSGISRYGSFSDYDNDDFIAINNSLFSIVVLFFVVELFALTKLDVGCPCNMLL